MTACVKTIRLSVFAVCLLVLLALIAGCTPLRRPPVAPVPQQPAPPAPPAPVPEPPQPVDPRHKASLQLTEQGRILLQQKRYDDAIRTLEQSITLYSQNGKSYYYMAEAWLAKGSFSQAAEFNRLAQMYLDNPRWSSRVNEQNFAIESAIP
jgi:tetratricopeptide (TPR) repeat protein